LKIAFIGAGQVNFGGGEGPWDHATRLETIANQIPLAVVGIADPFTRRAQQVLEIRQKDSKTCEIWKNTEIFADYSTMLDQLAPDAVFIGLPPFFHGSTEATRDVELQCAKRNVHMFIEKPISCAPVDEVDQVMQAINQRNLIVSVGYMFRYSKAVLKMKELIQQHGPARAFNGRYNCAYTNIAKTEWWDITKCGGPIIEQATHFCDLARFLVGEVDTNSVMAMGIKSTDAIGQLSRIPVPEELIPERNRISRVTNAMWRFNSGAVGSLMHGVLLHENKYESEIEVWGDGYRLVLIDPYDKCQLSVRLPNSETVEILEFENDDCYLTEDLMFLRSILGKNKEDLIKSSYEDSVNTYKMTVAIREAAK
jgi:predicted dehydrogenase